MNSMDANRQIELWTTRDGREIALDEMSDDHVANAVRVLSAWRNGLRKKENSNPAVVADLSAAIERFKRLERDRRRAAKKAGAKSESEGTLRSKGSSWRKQGSVARLENLPRGKGSR